MSLLLMLLAAGPAFAGGADCPAVPVGPPVDLEVRVGVPATSGRGAAAQASGTGAVIVLDGVPGRGTRCVAPPPPAGDALRGLPAPDGLLRDIPARDVLRGPVSPPPPPRAPAPPAPGG
jgi:hypothetical protein